MARASPPRRLAVKSGENDFDQTFLDFGLVWFISLGQICFGRCISLVNPWSEAAR